MNKNVGKYSIFLMMGNSCIHAMSMSNDKAMPHYVVFGNPIAHSISPQLHAAFAKQFGLAIDYQKQWVPLEQFKAAVDAFRMRGGRGANITLPFKIEAFHYANTHTERAVIAGAVNTFIFRDHHCIGDNTDGIGLMRDLHNHGFECRDKNIVILGAGGAVRGILGEIIQAKPQHLFIHNRTTEKITTLHDHFSPYFTIEKYDARKPVDLLINGTTIDFQRDILLACDLTNTVCYDLNYGARHYPFSQWAIAHHAKTILDGFGMLKEQAAESFFQWFGKRPQTSGMGALFMRRP